MGCGLESGAEELSIVTSSNMLVEDLLLDSISLPESVVDVRQLMAAWHLVVWVKRMGLPDRHWSLFKSVGLATDDILSVVCLLHVFALAGVETPDAFS